MAIENFINQLFIESINAMAGTKWEWPETWNHERKLNFLEDSLKYGETNELYEQCSIIRDVKAQIEK
jgi:hypothetical protein